jgi:acetate kinase
VAKGKRNDHADENLGLPLQFKGMCGTGDYKDISNSSEPAKKLAAEVFGQRITHYLGSYLLLLRNEVDAIVFSGGIGERAAELRASVTGAIDYLGVRIDEEANERASSKTHEVVEIGGRQGGHGFAVLRVLTDEELVCGQTAKEVLGDQ